MRGRDGRQKTHVKFFLVRPIVAPDRYEPFLTRELGIEQRLERVVEYSRHLARRCVQRVQHGDVVQVGDHGRHHHLELRYARLERAQRVDVRRVQWQPDLFVRFPELGNYIYI